MHNAKFHPIYVEDNYNKEAMQCEKCLKPYGSLYQLCEHLKKFHFNVKPKCMFCDEIFEVRKELSEHIKSFHAEEHKKRFKNLKNQEKLPCEQCGKMISKRFMHSHLRSHKEYVCDKCGKSFNFQAKLRYHIEDAHEEGHFVCDECGKVCSSQKKLKAHQKYHKEVKVPIYNFVTHRREVKSNAAATFLKRFCFLLQERTIPMYGATVIIFEGIFAFHDPEVRQMLNLKIFVDADADTRLCRRLIRDTKIRGKISIGNHLTFDQLVIAFERKVGISNR